MSTQIKIFVKHDDLPDQEGPNTVAMIVDESALFTLSVDKFIEAVGEAVDAGRKRVAGDYLVDYSSFGSDSKYLDRVDEVTREMSIERVELVGEKRNFSISIDDGEGEETSVEASGVLGVEAAFHAVWDKVLGTGKKPTDDIEDFLETMACDFEVTLIDPVVSSAPTP